MAALQTDMCSLFFSMGMSCLSLVIDQPVPLHIYSLIQVISLKSSSAPNSWQLSNSQNHTAQHARVNTDLTSKDRTLICKGKVSPFPLRNTFTSFRWSGCTHEKATEFSSVCHFFSCSKRDKINVGCKNKAVLPQLQAGWDKSKECVSQIKRQKTIIRFNRHGTFHSWD